MKLPAAVVDTNVVAAGLITGDAASPTARILDAMRRGAFPFLLSEALLAEYRQVLLRPKLCKLHGLSAQELDLLLTELATHAIVREPQARPGAPDAKDAHLWSLAQDLPGTVLVTGDLVLRRKPPPHVSVLGPSEFRRRLDPRPA